MRGLPKMVLLKKLASVVSMLLRLLAMLVFEYPCKHQMGPWLGHGEVGRWSHIRLLDVCLYVVTKWVQFPVLGLVMKLFTLFAWLWSVAGADLL